MTGDPTFWIIARATGITAYLLITFSMLAGFILKARPFSRLRPATVMEIHKSVAVLGVGAIGLHGIALVLDTAVPLPIAGLFVPGISSYRPLWTGLGVVAGELAMLVTASFWLRKRIGFRAWRYLHWSTYGVFALATIHGLAAGTDSGRPWALAMYATAAAAVAGTTAWRALNPPTKRPPPSRPPVTAPSTPTTTLQGANIR